MKLLVMKVKHFADAGDGSILLGGSIACDIVPGITVDIYTIKDRRTIVLKKIKFYDRYLDRALSGLSCGLVFDGISDMEFSSKDWFGKKLHEAEGVMIVHDTTPNIL